MAKKAEKVGLTGEELFAMVKDTQEKLPPFTPQSALHALCQVLAAYLISPAELIPAQLGSKPGAEESPG